VMVTHNPDDVLSLATHVVFLDKGEVVFSGAVEAFAKKQDNAQIVRFLEGETLP
jgi:ABC-type thiamine transport system ATPase subunit